MLLKEKNKMPEVSDFSVLPYIQNRKIGNLGKCFLTLKLDSCCNLSSETTKMNWVKNLKVKKCIKKKEIKFPRFPSFRFCSIPKIENLEISESVALLQILKVVVTFSKFVFSSERVSEVLFFCDFIETVQVVQKIRKFSRSIYIFINFSGFLTFSLLQRY